MSFIVEMSGINKSFPGVQALSDAQLKLERGEVLGLIGENGAGKSTLMNILSGLFPADNGEIILKGKTVEFRSPHDALISGISMIHQEIVLVPDLTIAENIWIGREEKFTKFNIINKQKLQKSAQKLMNDFGISLDCCRTVSSLNIAEMQLVEIIRAVSYNSDIIIMDEPTSALTSREVEILYRIIKKLKADQVSFIFISHKIDELLDICDRITVMRDSKYIDTVKTKDTTAKSLISMMVGRELQNYFHKQESKIGETILEVKDFCRKGVFSEVSFSLRKGEILGISGLVGSGRTEIVRALFGIDKLTSGEIFICGKKKVINSPEDAIRYGIAMVTEDRALSGLVLGMRVFHNISMVILKRLCKLGFIQMDQESNACNEMIQRHNIKLSSKSQLVNQLSGGNQQKVVLSKWLLSQPRILILDEPTRGIDVGSKSEIYKEMSELTNQGIGIIMISSELPEVLAMSDRVIVVRDGRITFECDRENASQERIMEYAIGSLSSL